MESKLFKNLIVGGIFLCSYFGVSQEFTSFTRLYPSGDTYRYQAKIKGDLTFIANNILNRDGGTADTEPEDAYNSTGKNSTNGNLNMRYIDVDNDNLTFSSSSATLTFPEINCNKIRYAALYWAATYPSALANQAIGTDRQDDFNQVKLKVPGGNYADITADEILYDGFIDTKNNTRKNSPYVCYADITDKLTAIANPEGEYTVANIRAGNGIFRGGGSSGGWTIVIVYENPTLSGKLISTFDGFARVQWQNPLVSIKYSGFKTLPTGPVRAKIGVAALEGDSFIFGDGMRIKSLDTDPFVSIENAVNPKNNFFNSNISLNGAITTNRTPNSINTLGYDTDIFLLSNPSNSIIPNSATQATFQFSSNIDQYYPFFNSFNVEVIEPNIILKKRVEDIGGNDITGDGVKLGQLLDYVLSFQNTGNDDATNYTIKDILPINVTLDESNFSLPLGVTYEFEPSTRTVVFTVPNNLIEENDPISSIRIRIKVSENCFDFVDACTDRIQNIAYSTYRGVISDYTITDDPSVSDFNNCGFVTPGTTNFLLDDLKNCDFSRTVPLCGEDVLLDAGDNFDNYIWYKDVNENKQIDSGDTVITDGVPDNDSSTLLVSDIGIYIVDKIKTASCKGFQEIIKVERFDITQTNPITKLINDTTNTIEGEIATCPNDGSQLPKVFLCGLNDTEPIQINIPDASSIEWKKLDEGSCTTSSVDCANRKSGCTWNTVGTGINYAASDSGQYKFIINYQNGCFQSFYFNVFKNSFEPQFSKTDLICTNPGNITVLKMPANYEYQLLNASTAAVITPYSANNGPSFDIASNGAYTVEMRQRGVVEGCVFRLADIGILKRPFQVEITTKDNKCNGFGEISISSSNVSSQYYYEISQNGDIIGNSGPKTDNNFTFKNLNPGDYVVVTKTDDGCEDSSLVTISKATDLTLSAVTTAHIGCNAGSIALTSEGGGDQNYSFAIWSKNGSPIYTSISDIPSTKFQTSPVFTMDSSQEGIYTFVAVDSNNCFVVSNKVTISNKTSLVLGKPTLDTPISCSATNSASITINTTGGVSPFVYSIDDGATTQSTPAFVGLGPGVYALRVTDASGCDVSLEYTIGDPDPLVAFAGISSDGSCSANGSSGVRFTNVTGGVKPYKYSFDGINFSSDAVASTANLMPGEYVLVVSDARGCRVNIPLTVEKAPPLPNITPNISYNCDGSANVDMDNDQPTYNFTYSIDGVPNIPADSKAFSNLVAGSHLIASSFISSSPPKSSVLLHEDFGSGPAVPSAETFGYCFEPQDGKTDGCVVGQTIADMEYSVTNTIFPKHKSWLSPTDHTSSDPKGRYLVINVGTPRPGQIIYKKIINDIIPSQKLKISVSAINLIKKGKLLDPDLVIQLRIPSTTTVVGSVRTNDIPKDRVWHDYVFSIDPEANTSLDFVVISEKIGNNGNDVAIDDILVEQIPRMCERSVDTAVIIEDGKGINANIISFTNVSCNGLNDGTITFEVENFDNTTGFEYSIDGGSSFITSLISPVTTTAVFAPGNQSIIVRRVEDSSCTTTISQTISQSNVLVAEASVTDPFTCNNTGATITATATGGVPKYQYQLENNLSTVVRPYQNEGIFTNIPANTLGQSYYIRVKDANACEDLTDTPITIDAPNNPKFTALPTLCYSGDNQGTIVVNATAGIGNYLFRMNNGLWMTPTPTNANTYTFDKLTSGDYNIDVRDAFGCYAPQQNITIYPALEVSVDKKHLSNCTSGQIRVDATGGTGTILYAFVLDDIVPAATDFTASNTFTVTDAVTYDIYVIDGSSTPCQEIVQDIVINPKISLDIIANSIDPECFDGLGSIDAEITSGQGPFIYTLVDKSPADGVDYSLSVKNVSTTSHIFYGIGVGDYELTITDTNNCTVTAPVITVANAVEISADITPILPTNCTSNIIADYGFKFTSLTTPKGNIEYSHDKGDTWQSSDELRGYASGTAVFPSIKVTKVNGVVCTKDFPKYIIPFPLDDLDIKLSAIVLECNILQIKVEGSRGDSSFGYEYTYSDNPEKFNPATAIWTNRIPSGTKHTFQNINPSTPQSPGLALLIPGRTYVFYVRDSAGCVRQSSVNVNSLVNNPIDITAEIKPSCNTANSSEITFTLNPLTAQPSIRWEVFKLGEAVPIAVSGGGLIAVNIPFKSTVTVTGVKAGNYFITINQVNATNNDVCLVASENISINKSKPLVATANHLRDISCSLPGLIQITNLYGGGGKPYTFDLTGPTGFTSMTGLVSNPVQIPVNSPSGDYTVSVNDQFGCPIVLAPITMKLSSAPSIDSVEIGNCKTPLAITINASGGTGNYLYSIDGGTDYHNTSSFNNLSPGTYNISIIDDDGCSDTSSVTIHPILQANVTLTKLLGCSASPDAEITINVKSGSGNYDYRITSNNATVVAKTPMPSNTMVFKADISGDYSITIFDKGTVFGCSRTFNINVPEIKKPLLDISSFTNVICNGDNNGTITVNATDRGNGPYIFKIISGGGSSVSSPILPTSNTATTASFRGLAAAVGTGTSYTIRATATIGECTTDINQLITQPIPIANINATVTEFGCSLGNFYNNASISIEKSSITGGSNKYVIYEFIDNKGTLATADDIRLQFSSTNTYISTNLSGGDYTINVYDDKGCKGSVTAKINAFDSLETPTIEINEGITCYNKGENITITAHGSLSDSSAVPHYSFSKIGSTITNTTGNFINLAIGNHSFRLTNTVTSCTTIINHTVTDPKRLELDVTKLNDIVCFDENDGRVQFNLHDNTNITYSNAIVWTLWNTNGTPLDLFDDISTSGVDSDGDFIIGSLVAGIYHIEVKQSIDPKCTYSQAFTILAPPSAITANVKEMANVSCANNRGKILVDPSGGVAPYTININSGTQNFTQNNVYAYIFEGLAAGNFSISITDALGCINTSYNQVLIKPNPIVATISADSELNCIGDSNGTVTATIISGGVGPFQYQLNRYDASGITIVSTSVKQTGNRFNNLIAGIYSVAISDKANCGLETNKTTISSPTVIVASLIRTRGLGCTQSAQLLLTATGGNPFPGNIYRWSINSTGPFTDMSGGNTHTFDVDDGAYSYYIIDANACKTVLSNEITEEAIIPLSLVIDTSAAVVNCNGGTTATIYAKAKGGLGNYSYQLSTDSKFTSIVAGPQTNGYFKNLAAGNYYIRVISNDCIEESKVITISEPTPLVVTQDFGNISCKDDDNGFIFVSLAGGSGNYTYAISPNLNKFDTKNKFTKLSSGDYTVIAQDINGCFKKLDFTIGEPDVIAIATTAVHETCPDTADASITISIVGGTAPYSTSIDSNLATDFVQDKMSFKNLAPGTHIIFVKDAEGCEKNIEVKIFPGINLNASIIPIYDCTTDKPISSIELIFEDDSIVSDVLGMLFALDSEDPLDMVLEPDFADIPAGDHYIYILYSNGCNIKIPFTIEDFKPLALSLEQNNLNQITAIASGGKEEYSFSFDGETPQPDTNFYITKTDTYIVRVTDKNGCQATAQLFMEFIDIEVPNFFSPNSDGKNDVWELENTEGFPEILTVIFDRYGREVYRMGIDDASWDGTYKTTELPTGDYWYIIKIKGQRDDREFVGHFTLYR